MSTVITNIFAVIFGILALVNVTGNVLIMVVISRNKSMRTPVNYLLLCLAVSDMMVGICSIASKMILPYIYPHPQGIFGTAVCKLLTKDNFFWICGHTSATILAVIAYERYQVVVHPYTATEKITNKRMLLGVVVCWVINMAIIFNWILLARVDLSTGYCDYDETDGNNFFKVFKYVNGVSFAVPFVLMVVLYTRVVWVMVKHTDQVLDGQHLAVTRMRRKVTTMLVVATIVYITTCGPLSVITVLQTSIDFFRTVWYEIKVLMMCLNSTTNAFIYALFSVQFRQAFKSTLLCRSFSNNRPALNVSAPISNATLDTKL